MVEPIATCYGVRHVKNIKHQLFASQAVVADMEAAGGGSIINMGSTSWMIGQGGMPCYTTAKSAVQGLTRGLARDLGPKHIRVNCVVPGWIMTERQISMWLTEESEKELLGDSINSLYKQKEILQLRREREKLQKQLNQILADKAAGKIFNENFEKSNVEN